MTKVTDAGLTAGDTAIIKGVLRFGSLAKKGNPNPNSQFEPKLSYFVTIAKPEVVKSNNEAAFKKYVKSAGFKSTAVSAGPNGEERITFTNSSNNAPLLFDEVNRDEKGYPSEPFLENELASGQEVQIQVRTFQPKKKGYNASISLDSMLIHDLTNPEYIGGSRSTIQSFGEKPNPNAKDLMAARGISSSTEEAPAAPNVQSPAAQTEVPEQPAAPAPKNTENTQANPFQAEDDGKKQFSDPFHAQQ